MKRNRKLLAFATGLTVCLIVVCFSSSIQGGSSSYKVKPEITLPEFRTDTARIIDAYERLIDRFMNVTDRNLTRLGAELKDVNKKLDSIDDKLKELSIRVARIENALSIEQPKPPALKKPQPQTHPSKKQE